MDSTKHNENRSFFASNRWLTYIEILSIVGFFVVAAVYMGKSRTDPSSPTISDAAKYLTEADALYEKQDLGRAVNLYWQALHAYDADKTEQNEKDRLHINLRIADIYSQSNWFKDAKVRLQHAAHIQPDHEDVLMLSGKFLRDDSLPAEATEQFLKLLEKHPDNAEANYLLGVLYQGSQQYKEATTYYKSAIENDPEFEYITSQKAPIGILARLQLSRTYNKMLQSYRFVDRELTSADMAEITRLETQSIILLKEAYKIRPDIQEIRDDLIRLLYVRANALKREAATRPYADALEVYEEIVELDPDEVQAWQEMAEIYESYLRNKPKALEMYRRVYALEPHATSLAIITSLEQEIANGKKQ